MNYFWQSNGSRKKHLRVKKQARRVAQIEPLEPRHLLATVLASWQFNELPSATVVADSSPNGKTLTLSGIGTADWKGPAVVDSSLSRSLRFDSTAKSGVATNISTQTADSISLWVMPDSTIGMGQAAKAIAHFGSTNNVGGTVIAAGEWSSGLTNESILLIDQTTWKMTIVNDVVLPAGRWSHLGIVWSDSAGRYDVYIDGQLKTVTQNNGHIGKISVNNTTYVGKRVYESDVIPFNGAIDSIQIYNGSLTGSELSALAEPPPLPTATLLAEWAFNDATSHVTSPDTSGHGFNVTLAGVDATNWKEPSSVQTLDTNSLLLTDSSEYGTTSGLAASRVDSISFSVKPNVTISPTSSSHVVAEFGSVDNLSGTVIALGPWTSGIANESVTIVNQTTGNMTVVTNVTMPAGQWTFFAISWNQSANRYDIYINGVLQSVSPVNAHAGRISVRENSRIGQRTYPTQVAPINGTLDELRLFAGSLTQLDATNLASPINALAVLDATTISGAQEFSTASANVYGFGDDFVPVDVNRTYELRSWARSGDGSGGQFNSTNKQYIGLASYDVDQNIIQPIHVNKYTNSAAARLTRALEPGHTEVYVDTTTGWYTGTAGTSKVLAVFGYSNSQGYTYPDYTYTRHVASDSSNGAWSSIDTVPGSTEKKIVLRSPWSGPSKPVNTAVQNNIITSTYNYVAANNLTVPERWTAYNGIISGLQVNGLHEANKFRPGTAFVKPMILANTASSSGNLIKIRDVEFSCPANQPFYSGDVVDLHTNISSLLAAPTSFSWSFSSGDSVLSANSNTLTTPVLLSERPVTSIDAFQSSVVSSGNTILDIANIQVQPLTPSSVWTVPNLSSADETIVIKRQGSINLVTVTANGTTNTYSTPALAGLDRINVESQAGNDTLIVDLSEGDVLPNGYIKFDGGVGNNELKLQGGLGTESARVRVTGSNTNIVVTDSILQIPDIDATITLQNIKLQGGGVLVAAGVNSLTATSLEIEGRENFLDVGPASEVVLSGGTFSSQANSSFHKRGLGTFKISETQNHGLRSEFVASGGRTRLNTNAGGSSQLRNLDVRVKNQGTEVHFEATQHLNSLVIDTGAKAILTDGDSKRLWLNGLDIDLASTYTSQLDIGSGTLIVDYANQPNPFATIQQMLRSSHSITNLGGPGITSSTVQAETGSTAFTSIGLLDKVATGYTHLEPNNRLTATASGNTALPTNTVLAQFAFRGDANLDRVVNSVDQTSLNNGIANQGPPGSTSNNWFIGDFDYSGVINSSDQAILTQGQTYHTTANRAPIIGNATIPSVTAGDTLRFRAPAYDPTLKATNQSPNGLTYSIDNAPTGATISSSTGDVTWINIPSGNQSLTIRVTQTGGGSLSATKAFTIPVTVRPDLKFEANGFTTSANSQALLQVTYNLTTATTVPFGIAIYGSTSRFGTTGDRHLMTYRISDPGLLTAGVHTVSFRPDFADPDLDYYLVAKIDADQEVAESFEGNNAAPFTGGVFLTLDGTVHVHGGIGNDTVKTDVTSEPGKIKIYLNTNTTTIAGDVPAAALRVRLLDGDDTFSDDFDQGNWSFPEWVYGGSGADTLTVRNGYSLIDAGSGIDTVSVLGSSLGDTVDVSTSGVQFGGTGMTTFRNAEVLAVVAGLGDDRIRYSGIPSMTLRIIETGGRWNFKFCDWTQNEKSWVLLYEVGGKNALHAWSSDSVDADSRAALADDVTLQSNDAENHSDLLDVFLNRSRDWAYWGSGIPAPIADYFDTELKRKLREQPNT